MDLPHHHLFWLHFNKTGDSELWLPRNSRVLGGRGYWHRGAWPRQAPPPSCAHRNSRYAQPRPFSKPRPLRVLATPSKAYAPPPQRESHPPIGYRRAGPAPCAPRPARRRMNGLGCLAGKDCACASLRLPARRRRAAFRPPRMRTRPVTFGALPAAPCSAPSPRACAAGAPCACAVRAPGLRRGAAEAKRGGRRHVPARPGRRCRCRPLPPLAPGRGRWGRPGPAAPPLPSAAAGEGRGEGAGLC